MKKKGFTLIELLAVIVVLAIIALIATPLVMNTIKNVRKGSAERSADAYIKRVETMVMEERTKGTVVADGLYLVNEEGNLCKEADTVECTDPYLVEMKGQKPDVGSTIAIENGRVVASLTSSSTSKTSISTKDEAYTIEFNNDGKLVVIEGNVPNKVYMVYQNGDAVYYDVNTGKSCNNYHEDNSLTGYNGTNGSKTTNNQNGCLKFYAFNDNSASSTVNLLLDHNTTAGITWNASYTNATGPDDAFKTQLANDTTGWVAETPSAYTDPTKNYVINYTTKSRLISAEEIAQITGHPNWNHDSYYFDTNNSDISYDWAKGIYTGNGIYGWLYDRTSPRCKRYGCYNNADAETYGYWTASADRDSSNELAWYVWEDGRLTEEYCSACTVLGIRPVIEVLKSSL